MSRSVTGRLGEEFLAFLLPLHCLGCDREIRRERSGLNLCTVCVGRLRSTGATVCALCNRHLDAAGVHGDFHCGACRRRPPAYDRLLSLWDFAPPLDAVVRGLKFHRLEYLGKQLAALVADRFEGAIDTCELVVPVPLHWRRELVRGYNQAEKIARPLARRLDRALVPALKRRKPTAAQTTLDRAQRRRNLRRAFATTRRGGAVCGRRVLLVDDVFTTGATLDAAARTLRRAGAANITALAVARTPGVG